MLRRVYALNLARHCKNNMHNWYWSIAESPWEMYHITSYHLSHICHISHTIYHISSYKTYHISDIFNHIPYIIHHISRIIYHIYISYITYHKSYILYLRSYVTLRGKYPPGIATLQALLGMSDWMSFSGGPWKNPYGRGTPGSGSLGNGWFIMGNHIYSRSGWWLGAGYTPVSGHLNIFGDDECGYDNVINHPGLGMVNIPTMAMTGGWFIIDIPTLYTMGLLLGYWLYWDVGFAIHEF